MNRRDFLIEVTSAIAGAAVCPSRSFAQNGIDLSAWYLLIQVMVVFVLTALWIFKRNRR